MTSPQPQPPPANLSASAIFRYLQPGMWLRLEELPNPFAHYEALILSQVSDHEWLTWIPEHGEYLLVL
ncbi:MAG: hypothetical protein RIE73_16945 [Coleofasciculus sp. C1-SOL-03]|jgi:hypothetical protein|uniref:hypothetical protein n=1 Tax=Coleofasciculus sp. C1-SOL-03 TaxID=3069522 RepID=UPI0032F7ED99